MEGVVFNNKKEFGGIMEWCDERPYKLITYTVQSRSYLPKQRGAAQKSPINYGDVALCSHHRTARLVGLFRHCSPEYLGRFLDFLLRLGSIVSRRRYAAGTNPKFQLGAG